MDDVLETDNKRRRIIAAVILNPSRSFFLNLLLFRLYLYPGSSLSIMWEEMGSGANAIRR
jgi:hypothetical protein